MTLVRLGIGDFEVGKPLPFELVDKAGNTLLATGYVVPNAGQLDRLIERGAYFDALEDETSVNLIVDRISVYSLVVKVAEDYEALLLKPIDTSTLKSVSVIAQEIEKLCALDADAALAFILLYKTSRYSVRHGFAAAILTEVLMRELKQSPEDVTRAATSALCMNLCILNLQDNLYQQDVALSVEQKQAIVLHPKRASSLLVENGCADSALLEIVADHHEMINGSGYASRKRAPDICLAAQVVSLADRYCAIVSERAYRAATPPDRASRELLGRQAATIDDSLSAQFARIIGVYPPGTVVSLANGETSVVVRRTLNPATPVVRSLHSRSGIRYPRPQKRSTSKGTYAVSAVTSSNYLKELDLDLLWPPIEAEGEGTEETG